MRLSNEEVADELGNRLANCPNDDLEDCVYSASELTDEDAPSAYLIIIVLLLGRHRQDLPLRYQRRVFLLVIGVIDEEVVLLRVDD